MKYFNNNCGVEQKAAREAHNLKVRGSSPLPAIFILCLLLVTSLVASCGISHKVNPDFYTEQELSDLPVDFTLNQWVGSNIKVSVYKHFLSGQQIEEAKQLLINDINNYEDCMYDGDHLDRIRAYIPTLNEYHIVIVPNTFECWNGQHGWCGGYTDSGKKIIVLSWNTPRNGKLAYDDHEIAHATGDYAYDHSWIKGNVKKCIKYMMLPASFAKVTKY